MRILHFTIDLFAYTMALLSILLIFYVSILVYLGHIVILYEPNSLMFLIEIILCLIGFVLFLRIYINFIRRGVCQT